MQEFLSISLVILLATISPGPDFAVVTKNSLLYSRRAGMLTALGVALSLTIHAIYCVLGLALIISQSLLAFSVIKYLGAFYLIYIGFKALVAKRQVERLDIEHSSQALTDRQAFTQGLLCNLLNPKAILFLLAFFTLVVKPQHSLLSEMGYGLEIVLISLIWFSSLSCLLTHPYVRANLSRVQFYVAKIMGVMLVGFGARIATLSHAVLLVE